ncbi:hypothetical protein GCM10019016_018960 [Streptomyces prasinosporus]|uniref:STAS domain-containing protein n=1 Tax=Streptomyces prasinosporus TaxID=68256 RepID=A0ABP6THS1_9ACTN
MPEIHGRTTTDLTESVVDGTTVLTPRGETDLLTGPVLGERLDALPRGARPDVVLDLRSVAFVDCSGLSVPCRARDRALAHDGRLLLAPDRPALVRLLGHARLRDFFEVRPRLPRGRDRA